MILPQPRVPPQVRACASSSSFAPTVQDMPPQTPKPHRCMQLIRISFFPRSPKTQGPKGVPSCIHTKSGRELFSKAWCLSSLMAQGPGEARHDIAAAPGPLHRSRRHLLQASRRRSTSDHPKPRNPTGICDSFEFRFFQDPQTKGPKGVQSRIHLWGFRGFG